MVNSNKRKGTTWESNVRDFLNSCGNDAHRVAQAGEDVGDVFLNGEFTLQCKDVARADYSGWLRSAKKQAEAASRKWGVVVHKRRQKGVGDGYVVMDLDTFAEISITLKVLGQLAREKR